MRIISKFKDFYDSALMYGSEDEPLYIRETKEFETDKYYGTREENLLGDNRCHSGLVYFCGTAFPFVQIGDSFYYTLDDIDKQANKLPSKDRDGYYYEAEGYWASKKDGYRKLRRRWFGEKLYHKDYLAPVHKWGSALDINVAHREAKRFCEQNKCPVVVITFTGRKRIYHNPKLADFQFIRVKDPFTAFQEISMWLSNQASNEDKIPKISNNDMIMSKGFDLKTSFRKPKWDKHEK